MSAAPSSAERAAALSPERRAELAELAELPDSKSRKDSLVAACEELGLDSSGTKKNKQDRLREALKPVSPKYLGADFDDVSRPPTSRASPAASAETLSAVHTPPRSPSVEGSKEEESAPTQPLTLCKPSSGPGAVDTTKKGCWLFAADEAPSWKREGLLTYAASSQTLIFALDSKAGVKSSPGASGCVVKLLLEDVWQYSLTRDTKEYTEGVVLELRKGRQPEASGLPLDPPLPTSTKWRVKLSSKPAGDEVEALLAASLTVNAGFFDNDFILKSKLGAGTFGDVFIAHERLDRYGAAGAEKVAAKVAEKTDHEALFKKEAGILKELAGCHYVIDILRLYSRHTGYQQRPTLVMRLAEGGNLMNLLINAADADTPNRLPDGRLLSLEEIRAVTRRSLLGLEYMHKRDIMHRDLKPDNVLLLQRDVPGSAVLGDLGEGKNVVANAANTIQGGTAGYLAPERANAQLGSSNAYDKPSDIWPVGVTLFTCLAESMPFHISAGRDDSAEERHLNWKRMLQNISAGTTKPLDAAQQDAFMRPGSEEARKLMQTLMRIKPAERPTAAEALKHPWFEEGLEADTKRY